MLTIGKLAGQTNVSNDTLRYYEVEGLIRPASKTPAGYRLYDRSTTHRVHFIKRAQQCGFTLAEIRGLLDLRNCGNACCGDVRKRTAEKNQQIENKIEALREISLMLEQMISQCQNQDRPIAECPIIAALDSNHDLKENSRQP